MKRAPSPSSWRPSTPQETGSWRREATSRRRCKGSGTTLLKTVDGEIADELQTQLTNLKALGELPDLP
jgi:hypothetical protein